MSVYLGIDIGSAAVKVVAMRTSGKVLASAAVPFSTFAPKPGWYEQDPEEWWKAVVKAVRAVIKLGKIPPKTVRGIGLAGQAGTVLLDKNQRLLRKAILENDARAARECEELENAVGGREQVARLVGNRVRAGSTATLMLHLRNHELKLFDKIACVLQPKDEIRRRMVGNLAVEASGASSTLLLDIGKRNWSLDLFSSLRLDRAIFPTVYEAEEILGTLSAAAAKELGLSTECLVVAGTCLQMANAVASGVVSNGMALSIVDATRTQLMMHSDAPKTDPRGRILTWCHAVRDQWCLVGNVSSAGIFSWFCQSLCPDFVEIAKRKKANVADVLDIILEMFFKEAAAANTSGLYFLPYLSGVQTPHCDPHARGSFVGLTTAHTRRDLMRAVCEGVAFSLRDAAEIAANLGINSKQLRCVGDGAKNLFWRQMLSDVLGVKSTTPNVALDAACGAAILAMVGGKEFRNVVEASNAIVKVAKEITPHAKTKRFYEQALPIYQGLYHSLRDDFPRLVVNES